jgi:hypothetical protein
MSNYTFNDGGHESINTDAGDRIGLTYGFGETATGPRYATYLTVHPYNRPPVQIKLDSLALGDLFYAVQDAYKHSTDCQHCGRAGGH